MRIKLTQVKLQCCNKSKVDCKQEYKFNASVFKSMEENVDLTYWFNKSRPLGQYRGALLTSAYTNFGPIMRYNIIIYYLYNIVLSKTIIMVFDYYITVIINIRSFLQQSCNKYD